MNIIQAFSYKLSPHRFGQIHPKSELGRWIKLISSFDEVATIVEIGCWNGNGSSRRIIEGAKLSSKYSDKQIIGLEASLEMYNKAKRNLKKFPNYLVLWGSIVKVDQLDDADLAPQEIEWLKGDIQMIQSSPNVLSQIPARIDLLILDGGEFATYSEFKALYSRIEGWIILDDTLVRKNRKVLAELLNDKYFNLVRRSEGRNGFAIFSKVVLYV
jgi:hypothetical protein